MDLYEKAEAFVVDSFTEADKVHQIKHFKRAVHWIKVLRPDADEALLIAAVAHDIERAFRQADQIEKKKSHNYTHLEFLRPHEERGADIIADFLRKEDAPGDVVKRVHMLVSRHEEGGNADQDLLKDADSISFFENNVRFFMKRKETEAARIRQKFEWMYSRITSDEARKLCKQWYDEALAELNT